MWQWGRNVDAVKVYPSGGLIYQKVSHREIMPISMSLRQLAKGNAVLVPIDQLGFFLSSVEVIQENIQGPNRGNPMIARK